MNIPLYLKSKAIPNSNINPLQQLAVREEISDIGEITSQMLDKYYKEHSRQFWIIVEQLGFLGVRFKGHLSKYNMVNDNVELFKIDKTHEKEEIDYTNLIDYKKKLLHYGMFLKGDLVDVPVQSIHKIARGNQTILLYLKSQGYYICNTSGQIKMVSDAIINKSGIKIKDCFNRYSKFYPMCYKLEKNGYVAIHELPANPVSFMVKEYKMSQSDAVDFCMVIKRMVEQPNSYKVKKFYYLNIRDKGQCIFEGRTLFISKAYYNIKISKDNFSQCPGFVRSLHTYHIKDIGDLPYDLSHLKEFSGIGNVVINKFINILQSIVESAKEKKEVSPNGGFPTIRYSGYVQYGKTTFVIPNHLYSYPLLKSEFINSIEVVDTLFKLGKPFIGDLPENLDELLKIKGIDDATISKFIQELQMAAQNITIDVESNNIFLVAYEQCLRIRKQFMYISLDMIPFSARVESIVKYLKGKKIKYVGDLPKKLDEFLSVQQGIGRGKIIKFMDELSNYIKQCENKKEQVLILKDSYIFLEDSMYNLRLNHVNFPNSIAWIDYWNNRGVYSVCELPMDLREYTHQPYFKCFYKDLLIQLHVYQDKKVEEEFITLIDNVIYNRPPTNLKKEKWDIFRCRITLDENGNIPTLAQVGSAYKISRQRVNQVYKKTLDQLTSGFYQKYIEKISEVIVQSGGIIHINAVLRDYDLTIHKKNVIKYIFGTKGLTYDVESGFLYNMSNMEYEIFIKGFISYLEDELPYLDISEEELDESIRNYRYGKMCNIDTQLLKDIALEKLLDHVDGCYNMRNLTKVKKLVYVFKKHFPQGLALYKEYEILYAKVEEVFPGEFRDDKRNIIAALLRVDSQEIFLWGWGYYKHKHYIKISKDKLLSVIYWIFRNFKNGSNQMSSYKPYVEHKDMLISMGIPNEHALYSCIKLYYPDVFYLPKDPWIYASKSIGPISNVEIVENFLLENKRSYSYEQLKEEFAFSMGWKEYTLLQAISNSTSIIRSGFTQYSHVDTLEVDRNALNPIVTYIINLFRAEDTVSIRMIFEKRKATCMLLRIDNAVLLYSLLKTYYYDEISFPRFPHLHKIGIVFEYDISYKKLLEDHLVECGTSVFKTEIVDKFTNRMGWDICKIDNAIFTSSLIVPVEFSHEYIHAEVLKWDSDKQTSFEDTLLRSLEELKAKEIYFMSISKLMEGEWIQRLPSLDSGACWTEDMVIHFANQSPSFITLGTMNKVIMTNPNEINVQDEIDLIAHVLKTQFGGAAKIDELCTILIQMDLITGVLPKSYQPLDENSPYDAIGNEIILRELREYYV